MRELGLEDISMEMVIIFMVKMSITMENGSMIKKMEMDFFHLMEVLITDNGPTTNLQVEEI